MPIFELHSKRRIKAERAGLEDVFQYENVPASLRSQTKRIFRESFGIRDRFTQNTHLFNPWAESIHDLYCREVGIDHLGLGHNVYQDILSTIDSCSTETFLDILELICRAIDEVFRTLPTYEIQNWKMDSNFDGLLSELNHRMREAAFGYQYESREIIRQDSKFIHDEITKPALVLLNHFGFSGVQEEFLEAHSHYRSGNYEEAIVEAAKSFESMMKAICDNKGWTYPKGGRAADLLKVLRSHALLPDYLDGSFDQLAATLASGLPKVRNDTSAHGQGSVPRVTPDFVAAYALHLAASKIVLLGEAAKQTT